MRLSNGLDGDYLAVAFGLFLIKALEPQHLLQARERFRHAPRGLSVRHEWSQGEVHGDTLESTSSLFIIIVILILQCLSAEDENKTLSFCFS